MFIEMQRISKSFGGNQVLKDVSLTIQGGEVHALMGENGAGKSTLMNILTGLHDRDTGVIKIDQTERYFPSPKKAEEFGISFIHQELNTWPEMTVLENIFLNKEIKNQFGLVNEKKMIKEATRYLKELEIDLDLNKAMGALSVGQQQMIEIVKALMTDAKILIMDEPTAALSASEIRSLFKIIKKLKENEVGIVYISHRMEEIFEICDVITVMRDGVSIATSPVSETDMATIVRQMVGRELTDYYPEKQAEIGEVKLAVTDLTGATGFFKKITFHVRSGEILGFSGLMGSGRTEIMRGLFGLDGIESGVLELEGQKIPIVSPAVSIKNGIGFLTEDRKSEGLILDFSVVDNISLPILKEFSKKGLVDRSTENEFTDLLIQRLQIKVQTREDIVGDLSGGNQQKVVLAKWIGIAPKVLILDEPTRGVDVGAKREIYQLINELAERGVAIIVISSDLPEILGISDRIVVIHEGKIAGELKKSEATQEKIMTLATGGTAS